MELHEMHLLRPAWLLALPPLIWLLWRLKQQGGTAGAWDKLVDAHLLPHLLQQIGGSNSRWPLWLLGFGWLLAVLALAGPSWSHLPQPVYQKQAYRVLLLDLSVSMNATDVPPSRLEHARYEVLDILQRSKEGQIALIAYGAEAYVVSPLTSDAATIALQVSSLNSDLLPVGGKNAAAALNKAHELLKQAGAAEADIILISDGLNHPAAAYAAATQLQQAGHKVSVLALGTTSGAPITANTGGFVKDDAGAIWIPKLDAEPLRQLAASGGGHYAHSRTDDRDLDLLLSSQQHAKMTQRQDKQPSAAQWREEGPWLLLALLPLAALAFRRGWLGSLLCILLIAPPQPTMAIDWAAWWTTPDQRGARALAADQPAEAARLFDNPAWRAAAHYQAGDYTAVLQTLENQHDADAEYNKGNALARLGQLQEALQAYQNALAQKPDHQDALHNRDLMQSLLEQQQNTPTSEQGEQGEQKDSQTDDASQAKTGSNALQNNSAEQTQSAETTDAKPPQDTDEPSRDERSEETAKTQTTARQPAPTDQQEQPGRADLLGQQSDANRQAAQTTDMLAQDHLPEAEQAMEQWLRRVPDDPAGLLRQRFLLQHLRNQGQLP